MRDFLSSSVCGGHRNLQQHISMPETQTRTPFPPPPQAAMKLSEALDRILSRQGQGLTAEFLKKTLLQLAR